MILFLCSNFHIRLTFFILSRSKNEVKVEILDLCSDDSDEDEDTGKPPALPESGSEEWKRQLASIHKSNFVMEKRVPGVGELSWQSSLLYNPRHSLV